MSMRARLGLAWRLSLLVTIAIAVENPLPGWAQSTAAQISPTPTRTTTGPTVVPQAPRPTATVQSPTPAPVAGVPALIPRTVLFGNPEHARLRISPDAAHLAFLAPDSRGVLQIWVRTMGQTDDRVITADPSRG